MKYSNLTDYITYFEHDFNNSDCVVDLFYTTYPQQLEDFLRKFFSTELADYQYSKKMDEKNWWDETIIQNAIPFMSVSDVGTCITAILRQDRFNSGTILRFIQNGILIKLLKHLKKLDN